MVRDLGNHEAPSPLQRYQLRGKQVVDAFQQLVQTLTQSATPRIQEERNAALYLHFDETVGSKLRAICWSCPLRELLFSVMVHVTIAC